MKLASSVARASYAPVSTRTAAAAPAAIPSRRAVGAALLAVVPSVMLSAAQPALALIPDDDDLELISKARANRTQRLAKEKGTEAAFSNAEGFKASPLAGAQAAVFTLQRAGAQLDAGDAAGAAETLNGSIDFVAAFSASAVKVSASAQAKASAADASSKLSALRSAAASGGGNAKAAFVGAARAVAAWANDAGVAGSLQGL